MLDQDDPVADFERLRVVVRDHHDRDVAARLQPVDQVDDQPRLARAHRRQRLVEQQDARVRHDTARATAIAWRWPPDNWPTSSIDRRAHATPISSSAAAARRRIVLWSSSFSGPPVQQFPLQEHVVVDAEPVDQRQILVDALDAERAGVVDRAQLDRSAVDKDLPRIRPVVAGQDLDQGRFAGAVVAEDAERLAARDAASTRRSAR